MEDPGFRKWLWDREIPVINMHQEVPLYLCCRLIH